MRNPPITELLVGAARGEEGADERLAEAVVARLERIATREMAKRHGRDLPGLTLEPAVFAHDALLRVLDDSPRFENRRHFFAYATRIIVRALIDYQRERAAQKRGGDRVRLSLSSAGGAEDESAVPVDAERMPEILDRLERLDRRKADVVRLRVFWGMTVPEVAGVLETSESTIERDWRFARRWMAAEIHRAEEA